MIFLLEYVWVGSYGGILAKKSISTGYIILASAPGITSFVLLVLVCVRASLAGTVPSSFLSACCRGALSLFFAKGRFFFQAAVPGAGMRRPERRVDR